MEMSKVVFYDSPKQVWFPCEEIKIEGHPFRHLNEISVHIRLNGELLIAFLPMGYVDCERKLLAAEIIAEDGDDFIMGIPSETLTTGARLRVPPADQGRIVPLETE